MPYRSEASFVVVIIGQDYPKRVWTQFESENFKHRFKAGAVVPVVLSSVELSAFDITNKIGYFPLKENEDIDLQVDNLVHLLTQKIGEYRLKESKRTIELN